MKSNLLLFVLAFASSITFGQTKETPKADEKPVMRKIASGTGAKQIEEQVEKAMQGLEIELKDLDIQINLDVLRSLEGLDEQIERSLEGLDEQIEASLEGLDEQIEQSVEMSLEGLDEQIEQNLEGLDHLDFDFDHDINININENRHESNGDIENFRREALRGSQDSKDVKEVKDVKDTKDLKDVKKTKKDPKKD